MTTLIRNITGYSGAIILQKIISFFYFTFLARSLGPTLAGSYFLGLSLFQIFLAFSDLGMMNYLIRETAQRREQSERQFGYVYGLRGILGLLAYVGLVITVFGLGYNPEVKAVALIAGLALFFDTFTYLHYGVLRGHQYLRAESFGVIVFQGVLVFVGALTVLFTESIVLLAISLTAASAANFLYSLSALRKHTSFKPRFQYDRRLALDILKQSIPFALIVIFARLYTQTDLIMLSKIGCQVRDCVRDLGLYTVSIKATLVIQSLPLSFMASIYPALSELFVSDIEKCRVLFQNTLKYLLMGICAVVVVFGIFGDPAVELVWGSEYAGSVLSLQMLLLGSVFVVGTYPVASLLNSTAFQRHYAMFTLAALLVNIAFNSLIIPLWGIFGAAVASLAGSIFLFSVSALKVRSAIQAPFERLRPFVMGLFCSSLGAFVLGSLLFVHMHFVIGSLLTTLLYVLFLVATRTLKTDEIKTFFESFKRSSVPNDSTM